MYPQLKYWGCCCRVAQLAHGRSEKISHFMVLSILYILKSIFQEEKYPYFLEL